MCGIDKQQVKKNSRLPKIVASKFTLHCPWSEPRIPRPVCGAVPRALTRPTSRPLHVLAGTLHGKTEKD
jgi:hypothetical protein